MVKETCPECGDEYERLSTHWAASPEHRPEYTDKQWEILVGILMGDASIHPGKKTPNAVMQMINEEYLNHLRDVFGILSANVHLYKSGVEQGKRVKESGFSPNANPEDYSDVYQWQTKAHHQLRELRDWYSTGKKMFPDDLELTPTTLKHWFVCDGYHHIETGRVVMSVSNEYENPKKIDSYFEEVGLPTPVYDVQERKDGSIKCNARWNREAGEELLDYMGDPLPGFEYKWH